MADGQLRGGPGLHPGTTRQTSHLTERHTMACGKARVGHASDPEPRPSIIPDPPPRETSADDRNKARLWSALIVALFLLISGVMVLRHPRVEPTVPLLPALAAAIGTICFLSFLRFLRRRRRR